MNQAVRIGKLKAAELGQRWRIPVTLNLFGLNLLAQRTCRFESAQFDLAIDCKIESPKLNTDGVRTGLLLDSELPSANALAATLRTDRGWDVVIPKMGAEFPLV